MGFLLAPDSMADGQIYELTEAPASRPQAGVMSTHGLHDAHTVDSRLHSRTLLKLDCLLLPFLALLFLFNALDKSNVGSCAATKRHHRLTADRLEMQSLPTSPRTLESTEAL